MKTTFTPNKDIIKIETSLTINSDCDILNGILAWSPILGLELVFDADDFQYHTAYDISTSNMPPKDYTGQYEGNKDWTIFTAKNGNPNQVFWISSEMCVRDENESTFELVSNGGQDIDIDTELSIEYDTDETVNIILSDKDGYTWGVGSITDWHAGKMVMYSAIESDEELDTDEDGEAIFKPVDQVKFEAVKQLFIAAGFKIRMNRYPRNS